MTRREDRSGLPFASDTGLDSPPSSAGLTGKYTQAVLSWEPNLPLSLPLSMEEQSSPSRFDSASLGYSGEYDLTTAQGYSTAAGQVTDTYTRDTAGRVTKLDHLYGYDNGTVSFTPPSCTYAYEPTSDRLATVVNADGRHDFAYDTRGLVHTMTIANEGTYTFGYDSVGRNQSLTYPDGHQRVQQYDPEGRLTSRCYQYANGSTTRCYTATYDAAGNPLTMTDPEGTDTFAYDGLYRVTSATRQVSGNPSVSESYGYNALGALNANAPETAGNVLDDQRPRIGATGTTAPSAVMNTVNGAGVTVDPAGRITGLAGATLTFNKQNRPTSVTSGSNVETYSYDSALHRVARQFGSSSEYYVYEGENIVGRLAPDGSTVDTYLYDGVDSPLRLMRQQHAYYYELDLVGNVRRLRDATGADLGGYRYTAFGQLETADAGTPVPSIDQALRWKGRWFVNVAGGLYDVRTRWWSPKMGAFLTVDGFMYHDRSSTLWGWRSQNPLRWSDPTGRFGFAIGGNSYIGAGPGIGVGYESGSGVFFDITGGTVSLYTSTGAGTELVSGASVGAGWQVSFAADSGSFWNSGTELGFNAEIGGAALSFTNPAPDTGLGILNGFSFGNGPSEGMDAHYFETMTHQGATFSPWSWIKSLISHCL